MNLNIFQKLPVPITVVINLTPDIYSVINVFRLFLRVKYLKINQTYFFAHSTKTTLLMWRLLILFTHSYLFSVQYLFSVSVTASH